MGILLDNFEREYFIGLDGSDQLCFSEEGVYHLILVDHKKAGVIGFIPLKKIKDAGFLQVVICSKYRGRGILKKAQNLLAQRYRIKIL